MPVSIGQENPAPWRARNESQLKQVGFIHIFDSGRVLAGRSGDGIKADRTSAELLDHSRKYSPVDGVKPKLVNLKHTKPVACGGCLNNPIRFDLCVIPDPS